MKKMLILLIITAGLSSHGFSQNYETTWALGFEYGNFWSNYFDGSNDVKAFSAAPAINLHSLAVVEGYTLGIFAHAFVFGLQVINKIDGLNADYNRHFGFQTGLLTGTVYVLDINDNFSMVFGAGIGFILTVEFYDRDVYTQSIPFTKKEEGFSCMTWDIGVGADISVRYRFSETISLFAGSIITFDFFRYIDLESSDTSFNSAGWARDFSKFSIRPYISIAFSRYSAMP